MLFESKEAADHNKYLWCTLSDGRMIERALLSYNHSVDEGDDRQLVIAGPYIIRAADGSEHRFDTGAVTLLPATSQVFRCAISMKKPMVCSLGENCPEGPAEAGRLRHAAELRVRTHSGLAGIDVL